MGPESLEPAAGIRPAHRREVGEGRLERLVVENRHARAHIYLHGAHVTHFQARESPGGELLWLSPRSFFQAGKAIRGGAPICFPWFGAKPDDSTAPSHGLVRTRKWDLVGVEELDNGSTRASFDTAVGAFSITHTVTVGCALVLRLDVYNRGRESAVFEAALHTYIRVGDVERVSVRGLERERYIDKTRLGDPSAAAASSDGMIYSPDQRPPDCVGEDGPLLIRGETDRVYLDTESPVRVVDPVLGRVVTIDKSGSRSTVVWNPGRDKARRLSDLGVENWRPMLCVETANVADNAVELPAGGSHTMSAIISAEPYVSR